MSVAPPTTPRRGIKGKSHLRNVSNGSSQSTTSDTGTAQHDPIPVKLPTQRKCTLWVHEEAFSKDDVVLDLDLFPDVKPGELMDVGALKADSGVRDFQEAAQPSRKDGDSLSATMQRQRSNSNSDNPSTASGNHARRDSDFGKRYLFIAQEMPKEVKVKQARFEISVAKHIADLFGLKHRSQVLVSTVSASTILLWTQH